jgi:hypothetical protein
VGGGYSSRGNEGRGIREGIIANKIAKDFGVKENTVRTIFANYQKLSEKMKTQYLAHAIPVNPLPSRQGIAGFGIN